MAISSCSFYYSTVRKSGITLQGLWDRKGSICSPIFQGFLMVTWCGIITVGRLTPLTVKNPFLYSCLKLFPSHTWRMTPGDGPNHRTHYPDSNNSRYWTELLKKEVLIISMIFPFTHIKKSSSFLLVLFTFWPIRCIGKWLLQSIHAKSDFFPQDIVFITKYHRKKRKRFWHAVSSSNQSMRNKPR